MDVGHSLTSVPRGHPAGYVLLINNPEEEAVQRSWKARAECHTLWALNRKAFFFACRSWPSGLGQRKEAEKQPLVMKTPRTTSEAKAVHSRLKEVKRFVVDLVLNNPSTSPALHANPGGPLPSHKPFLHVLFYCSFLSLYFLTPEAFPLCRLACSHLRLDSLPAPFVWRSKLRAVSTGSASKPGTGFQSTLCPFEHSFQPCWNSSWTGFASFWVASKL